MSGRLHVLDGLRGWAAFLVMWLHICYQIVPPKGIYALQLENWWPVTGQFAVAVFFLVSGFSLSIGFLKTGHRHVLSRMVFGRYFRLVIPVLAACAIMSLFMNTGLIPAPEDRPATLRNVFLFEPTLAHLLEFSLYGVLFDYTLANSYAPPLWTIAFEYVGTILVALLLLGLGHPAGRRAAYAAIAILFFVYLPWYFLFIAGLIAAGMHAEWGARLTKSLCILLIAASLVIAVLANERPHLIALAASLFFVGALHWPPAQRFFSTRLSIALGELSFPLYLIHVPVAFAIGLPIHMAAPDSVIVTSIAAIVSGAASVLAAVILIPVNTWSIHVARWAGARPAALLGRDKPKADPGPKLSKAGA